MATADAFALEQSIADEYKSLAEGLESARLKQERRTLRLMPDNLNWEIKNDVLELEFDLPSGAFATMLLRECVNS